VPVNRTIFTWTAVPFLFDYGRNRIYPINESGLVYNLQVMPFAKGIESMREYFLQYGIHYIIWEYKGYGMKKPDKMGSLQNNLISTLQGLVPESEVLYNDGNIILFKIDKYGENHS